jgi:hypothetical protein
MNENGIAWLRFLRQYGPTAKNDSMYDETIRRSARRHRIKPLDFEHPAQADVSAALMRPDPPSVILTGTAGDGKTHLCRGVWERLGGEERAWATDAPYLTTAMNAPGASSVTLHVLRDLSAWVPLREAAWPEEKVELLTRFSRTLWDRDPAHVFLIAANDGQLIETWRRLPHSPEVARTRQLLETLLVEDRREAEGAFVQCFNLSRGSSAELFDRALDAFLAHDGWQDCLAGSPADDEAFGPNCPIRHNVDLLRSPLVRGRLRSLFELCDANNLHIPIRQILLLLANAVLGHPGASADWLLTPADVPLILRAGTRAQASLYNNIFGGNLTENRRESLTIFDYFSRFRIGEETSNRIDNVLIFGEADDTFRPYFDELLAADTFYGADDSYRATQRTYIEAGDEDESAAALFLEKLVGQRRGLFFKIPLKWEEDLRLWELTVFHYAGEYLDSVNGNLRAGGRVPGPILARLVRGLNRIFVGMLVSGDRELYLATSLSFSTTRVSRLLEERVSVAPRLGEKVEIIRRDGRPVLNVVLAPDLQFPLSLNLVRYEFLSRVADGALPSSFSRECHEDMLAFKSQLLAGIGQRRAAHGVEPTTTLTFHLFDLDDSGVPSEESVEVATDA